MPGASRAVWSVLNVHGDVLRPGNPCQFHASLRQIYEVKDSPGFQAGPLSQTTTTSDWSKKTGDKTFPNLRGTLPGPSRSVDTKDRHSGVLWSHQEAVSGLVRSRASGSSRLELLRSQHGARDPFSPGAIAHAQGRNFHLNRETLLPAQHGALRLGSKQDRDPVS